MQPLPLISRDPLQAVCLLLLFTLPPFSQAAALERVGAEEIPQYISRVWQTDEGLPNNSVQAIAQTKDGYLWVGTRDGLVNFDGTRFNTLDRKISDDLGAATITALCRDRRGGLWIGSDGGGVFHVQDGTTVHYGKTNGLAGDNIRMIYAGRDGSIWIGTATGLSQFSNNRFVNYTRLYFTKQVSLVSSIINSVAEDNEGNLWVATSGGLNRIKGTNVDQEFTITNGLPDNIIHIVFEDKEGRLWIGSNTGLAVYENGMFHTYTTKDGLSDNFITSLYEDSKSNLWVGNYGGLNRFVNGSFITDVNEQGKPYDQVNAIFADREGDIWLGSKEGLIQLTPKRFVVLTKREGLSYNNIMSVLEDREGRLCICTWGGGMDQINDGKVKVFGPAQGLFFPMVLSTCEGRDGSLWLGAEFKGGLSHFQDGQFTYYTEKDGLIGAAIKVIHEDRFTNLWIGTSMGLSRMKDGKFTNFTSTNSRLPGDIIKVLCEDPAGEMWIGTDQGLSRWENTGKAVIFTTKDGLSDNVINAIYEDTNRDLWIGTDNGGLNHFKNGRFTSYTTKQGLLSDCILEILEDDHGWLWMSCYKGIFRVRKSNLDDLDQGRAKLVTCIAYGKADGMESAQCNGVAKPAGWKTRDGHLLFPTTKGLVSVNQDLKFDEVPPPVVIDRIIADKKDITMEGRQARPHVTTESQVTDSLAAAIPPGNGELEFQYGAVSFSSPFKDRFKYKLEGIDADWVDAGTRRLAHYNNIYPGHYRFRVKASNNDGVWDEDDASVALILLPHIWQTRWFFGLAVIFLAGGVAATARSLSGKKMRRKLALLGLQHSMEKERARIARDIHDDLGCRLTQITLLSDEFEREDGRGVQANTRKISATAREMARSLDEIVWAINPEHDTLEGLVNYLSRSADEFLEDTNIRWQLKAPTEVPALTVPANVRHNLFLAFKEGLNNSVKHSGTEEIQIQFVVEPARFQIIIADTGVGFEASHPRAEGNGLKNMRGRMEDIRGQFVIVTQPGQGTTLKMTIFLA